MHWGGNVVALKLGLGTFPPLLSCHMAQPLSKAREEIEKMSGSQFDPLLVDVFGRMPVEELRKVRLEYADEVS